MPEVKPYLVVDSDDTSIVMGGPYLWDGVSGWIPPEAGTLLPEEDWRAMHPAQPDPDADPQ